MPNRASDGEPMLSFLSESFSSEGKLLPRLSTWLWTNFVPTASHLHQELAECVLDLCEFFCSPSTGTDIQDDVNDNTPGLPLMNTLGVSALSASLALPCLMYPQLLLVAMSKASAITITSMTLVGITGLAGFAATQGVLISYDCPRSTRRTFICQSTAAIYASLAAMPWLVHFALHHVWMGVILWLGMFSLTACSLGFMCGVDEELANAIKESAERYSQRNGLSTHLSPEMMLPNLCGAGVLNPAVVMKVGSRAFALSAVSWCMWCPQALPLPL